MMQTQCHLVLTQVLLLVLLPLLSLPQAVPKPLVQAWAAQQLLLQLPGHRLFLAPSQQLPPQLPLQSQPNQAHTFSFGTAAGPSSFPRSNPAAHSGKPFVFGAKASAAAQATANGGFPPPGGSQAAAQEPAAQPASVNIAFPRPLGRAAAPSASATAQSMPVQFSAGQASSSAGLRNGLHSPSGIAKHTGPGRHGRAVPSSPGARRGVRVSPGKQLNGDDRPAGFPNQWTPAHPLADPHPWPTGGGCLKQHTAHTSGLRALPNSIR